MKPKVMIAVNAAWNLVNFRSGLIRALVAQGYEVVAVAPPDAFAPRLQALGCRYLPLQMDNQGTNPARDLLLLARFRALMRRERPAAFLGYTIKPNVYGSLAAHGLGIPVVANIAGLGASFVKQTWLTALVRRLYRVALRPAHRVFFQNEDDRLLFTRQGLVCAGNTQRLPGSGVDLDRFAQAPQPPEAAEGRRTRFLLVSRMLWDKGVGEFVEAGRQLRQAGHAVDLRLLGFLDVQNPAAIPRSQIEAWVREGVVSYDGAAEDVRPALAAADCVVLPSYREGVPRSLLEAAATGRPIVTTDAPGCRDVVDDGINGLLCRVRDAQDLARCMEQVCRMSGADRITMGRRGREKAVREFDERIVIRSYLEVLRGIVHAG